MPNAMQKIRRRKHTLILVGALVLGAVLAIAGVALLMTIIEHKNEAKQTYLPVVPLTEENEDPATWGKNFPLQYESFRKTSDQVRTRFGGSEAVPRTPTEVDPRSVVAQSKLDEDPRLKVIWSGYAFSKDFREERGHAYMLDDQSYTERQHASAQPGACVNCHASTYVPMKKLGGGDLMAGFAKINKMPYAEARSHVQYPVSCIDCHNPTTMELRVTKPAFMIGIKALKKSQGIADYDVNTMATHQEMRSFVCGQCHVEYYFTPNDKTLTFPWADGIQADQILEYYERNGHKDWVHKDTNTPALKAQHPEFELFQQGIHARSGVACADCHMPFQRVGATKVTDHHVRSPLLNINRACQTCHRQSEAELTARVNFIQERTYSLRNVAMDAVVELIDDIKLAQAANAPAAQLDEARGFHRRAQFLLDFVEAENSTGFHAPQEAMRILGLSLENTRKGQISLRNPRQPTIPK